MDEDEEDFASTKAETAGPMGITYTVTPCCHAGVRLPAGTTTAVRTCRRCNKRYTVEVNRDDEYGRAVWQEVRRCRGGFRHWFTRYGYVGSSSPTCGHCGTANPNYDSSLDPFAKGTA